MFEIINGVLPQLQCKKCGFPDCDAYAKALDVGKTDLNRCSPGGDATIKALAKILQKDIYVLSDIIDVKGLQHMKAYLLRAGGLSTRVYCNLCYWNTLFCINII